MNLIDDVAQWKKLWSMRAVIVSSAISSAFGAYVLMPPDFRAAVPHWVLWALAGSDLASSMAVGVVRVIKQPTINPIPFTPTTPKDAGS